MEVSFFFLCEMSVETVFATEYERLVFSCLKSFLTSFSFVLCGLVLVLSFLEKEM